MLHTFFYNDGSTNISYIGWTLGNGDGTHLVYCTGTSDLPDFGASLWAAISTDAEPGRVWNAHLYRAGCPMQLTPWNLFPTSGTAKGFWKFSQAGGPIATFTVP